MKERYVKISLLLETEGDTEESTVIATVEVPAYLYGWKLKGYKWEPIKDEG